MTANHKEDASSAGAESDDEVQRLLDAMPDADAPSTPTAHSAVNKGRPASFWLRELREANNILDELYEHENSYSRGYHEAAWSDAGNRALDAYERLDRLDYLGQVAVEALPNDDVAYLKEVLGLPEERARVDAVGSYIEVLLAEGALDANYLQTRVLTAGAELRRFRRACARLGVQTEYVGPPGTGQWMSSLPPADPRQARAAGDPE